MYMGSHMVSAPYGFPIEAHSQQLQMCMINARTFVCVFEFRYMCTTWIQGQTTSTHLQKERHSTNSTTNFICSNKDAYNVKRYIRLKECGLRDTCSRYLLKPFNDLAAIESEWQLLVSSSLRARVSLA